MHGILELEEIFDSCITDTITLCRFKNSPNTVSLLTMPFALNCMMVNEFSSTACVGIGGGCSFVVPYSVGAVVAVTVMHVLLFVLHVCLLRDC